MPDDRDVSAGGACRAILGHRVEDVRVPRRADHRGERVTLAPHYAKGTGEFGLIDQQALVHLAGVHLHHLVAGDAPLFLDRLLFLDGVAHRPDQSLATRQAGQDAAVSALPMEPPSPTPNMAPSRD